MTVVARTQEACPPGLGAVQEELAQVDRELFESVPEELGLVSEASRHILRAGGKRLRPALVLLSSRAFGGITRRSVVVAGALEMIHGASLLHDDVVDNAKVRRGRATVGAYWSNKIAVMMGDYLFTRSLIDMSHPETVHLTGLLAQATGRMVMGQIREIEEQGNLDITVDEYLFIIREKTAALMAVSCRLGAILGKASPASVQRMDDFGLYLGMAFQIVDDCLDFWGDEDALGKPVGSDLSERKFTLPFIHTLHSVHEDKRRILLDILAASRGRISRRNMRRVLSIMEEAGAREYAMQAAVGYCGLARQALQDAGPLQGVQDFEALLDYVLERSS